jgi:hypothetical protein
MFVCDMSISGDVYDAETDSISKDAYFHPTVCGIKQKSTGKMFKFLVERGKRQEWEDDDDVKFYAHIQKV